MINSRPWITAFFVLIGCLIVAHGYSQKGNIKKNTKLSSAENSRYEKDLKEHPDSAEPHWRHAKIVGAYTFNEAEEAWRFYELALKIDSTNALIWSDFGDYLLNVFNDKKVALNLFKRAQELDPTNKNYTNKVEEVTKSIELIQETARLRSIGSSDHRKIDHDIAYSVISNLDSLQAITSQTESPYFYVKLLQRFLEDDPLNEWETYLLCLGYATTKDYSPYSQVSNDLYKLNREGNYNKTLEREQEVLSKNPVSGSLYQELMYAHRRKGENDIADRYQRRAQRLYEAMIFTGDGTCEKPYITLTTTEEYALINYLGLYSAGEQALTKCNGASVDRLVTVDDDRNRGELYFDVRLLFKSMSERFKK